MGTSETGRRPVPATERDLDLLVLGEINPDVVVTDPDPHPAFGQAERTVQAITLTIGGSSAITACGAARLGLRVAMVGVVGDDVPGSFMLAALAEHGVDVSARRVDATRPTGVTVVLTDGADRAMLSSLGTTGTVRATDVSDALLRRARHLHVGSYFLQDALRPELPELFERAHALGVTTSVDPNFDPSGAWSDMLAEVLAVTDVFLPNAVEACRITGRGDPEDAAARLSTGLDHSGRGPLVAVKLGAAGGLISAGQDELVTLPAFACEAIDDLGAGDNFDAGFLAGFLGGEKPEACLALAIVCGSLSTRAVGGTGGQVTMEGARAALEHYPGVRR